MRLFSCITAPNSRLNPLPGATDYVRASNSKAPHLVLAPALIHLSWVLGMIAVGRWALACCHLIFCSGALAPIRARREPGKIDKVTA